MADRLVAIGTGKTYTSISAAFAGEADFQAGEDNIIFEIDAGSYAPLYMTAGYYTTSASHQLILRCATGSFHDYTRNTGVIVKGRDWIDSPIRTYFEYVIFKGISFDWTDNMGSSAVTLYSKNTLENCFIYGGLNCLNTSADDKIINTVIVGGTRGCNGYGAGNTYLYNCIILNNTSYGIEVYNQSIILKNCYIAGSGTSDLYVSGAGSFTLTTSYTEDGSLSSPTLSIASCNFTNSTAGSENINITSGSSLIDIGTNLSSDAVYPFNTDGMGNTRMGTWDTGVIEYISSGGVSGHPAVSRYKHISRNQSVRYH